MTRTVLKDEQWDRIKDMLPGKVSDPGPTADNRLFIESILWLARTGAPWRDMPEEFGDWHNIYNRFSRWSLKGIWNQVFEELSQDCDMEYLMVDGSITRVHQHGAPKKRNNSAEAVGKSRGGLTTSVHAATDALGNPVRFILTAGQASEYGQANALIEGFSADFVLADKGYDSNAFLLEVKKSGAEAVIPPKRNRIDQRKYDKEIYKERNLIERLFQKLKNFRRVATRYERLARNYMGMLQIAAIMIWLA
ncbi:IS5 family transposase [Endozoicomonas sp. 8E]|uniref:IS5 family transposase n=1 Tax=Endozoicomonas sp. 8E TaxID=3035692 RepID=UPI002938DFE2|nr:IS5 family transposase [Endozoicomonas sp. 8E]WOG29998.1 IS5 family transposase [Endozoicomonas sp. 8E]